MYNPAKAAQIAAYFANRQGGLIDKMKLIKLMYLADRVSLVERGYLISDDDMYSLTEGPILSRSLDLMRGKIVDAGWSRWIRPADQPNMQSTPVGEESLDELSPSDLSVLRRVWNHFGNYTGLYLSKWTHKYCKEWKDPHGSRIPIKEREVLLALGKPQAYAEAVEARVSEGRALSKRLAELA